MSAVVRKYETYDHGGETMHCWYLYGERGVVQFKASPQSAGAHEISMRYPSINTLIDGWSWTGWDLGYHSPRPIYDSQKPMDSCDILEGQCYYDGTSLGASELLGQWAASGRDDEVIWRELADRYDIWLCSEGETFASPVTALISMLGDGS